MLNREDKADVARSFGKKAASEVSKATKDGFDGNKRWGNSAIKGHGVNSPAMMEARKGFEKSKSSALHKKMGKNKVSPAARRAMELTEAAYHRGRIPHKEYREKYSHLD